MRKSIIIEQLLNNSYHVEVIAEQIDSELRKLEGERELSPIEILFAMEYVAHQMRVPDNEYTSAINLKPNQKIVCSNGRTYYADFIFESQKYKTDHLMLLIELDGHEFHEKTKEQVEKDKARERALIKDGYTLLRYAGTEIKRSSITCVAEAFQLYKKRLLQAVAGESNGE